MENCYEQPSFTTATDNTYEVPQPRKADSSSEGKVEKYSCNWKLCVLFVCLGVFAVVASVSLALTVWSIVRDRDSSLQVPDAMNSQLTSLQDFQHVQQNQLDDFQNQLNSFREQYSLYNQLTTLQQETRQQLNNIIMIAVQGLSESNPASSCSAIPASNLSGYYWIRHTNGSAVRVYCDMTRSCGGVTGGWTRVAYLQFENGSDPCPQGFRERNDYGIRTCGIDSTTAACPSILFDTYGIPYSRVCGKVLGYQYHTPDAFGNFGRGMNLTIDSNYVDGVSLTHGDPRHHIWTFAAATDELGRYDNGMGVCPCSNPLLSRTSLPPQFVGQHYFCDSGAYNRPLNAFPTPGETFTDPLWDGAGCGGDSTCCSFNNPPWFQRELLPTTDDIEMRVCSDERRDNEDIPIAHVEIYVH